MFKNWLENRRKKLKEEEFINRRETIMHSLVADLETDKSIELFKEINELYYNVLANRKNSAQKEIETVVKFFEDETI